MLLNRNDLINREWIPVLFSQSQDKLRTKELEFIWQQLNLPLIVIGPLTKESNSFVL